MDLHIGLTACVSKTITEADVYSFAELSGDYNPVHMDKEAAQKSIFKKQIAHGILVGSLISNILGMQLPGPGAIYLEQNFKFLKPVFFGDKVTAYAEVAEIINESKGIYKFKTYIRNQAGDMVLDGYAIIKYKKEAL